MPEPSQNVRGFVQDAYQLISANSPTVPLHGNDLSKGIQFLNELLLDYSANGLLLTVAREASKNVLTGEGVVTIGSADFVPTPDITEGRLSSLIDSWLILEGVTYPLIPLSPSEFDASFKYDPLEGLPRYIIIRQETDVAEVRIYPAPSQAFEFFIRGKFEVSAFDSNDTMESLPKYYMRYLKFALARDLAAYKGRADAWTPFLQDLYDKAYNDMVAASEVNLDVIVQDMDVTPNGAWRVRSGI